MLKYLSVLVVFAVALTLGVAQVQAAFMAVNFDFEPASHVTYSGIGAAPDAGTYWNSFPSTASGFVSTVESYTGTAKASDGSTVTSVKLWVVDNSSSDYPYTGAPSNLLRDYFNYYTGSTPQTIDNAPGFTIGGLATNGIYDLYLYSCTGSWHNATTEFSVGGVQKGVGNTTNQSFVENDNYVKFTGLTPDASGYLDGNKYWGPLGSDGTYNAVFNGLQIVETGTVPEPGTIILLATGLLGLLAYAWRKRK